MTNNKNEVGQFFSDFFSMIGILYMVKREILYEKI